LPPLRADAFSPLAFAAIRAAAYAHYYAVLPLMLTLLYAARLADTRHFIFHY